MPSSTITPPARTFGVTPYGVTVDYDTLKAALGAISPALTAWEPSLESNAFGGVIATALTDSTHGLAVRDAVLGAIIGPDLEGGALATMAAEPQLEFSRDALADVMHDWLADPDGQRGAAGLLLLDSLAAAHPGAADALNADAAWLAWSIDCPAEALAHAVRVDPASSHRDFGDQVVHMLECGTRPDSLL